MALDKLKPYCQAWIIKKVICECSKLASESHTWKDRTITSVIFSFLLFIYSNVSGPV